MKIIERGIFQNQREYVIVNYLRDKIENSSYKIIIDEDKGHSQIFGIQYQS